MAGKLELNWKEDARSIGILVEGNNELKHKPLIMLNFEFLGYISGESHPYRGYQVLIKTAGGNDFIITITEKEIQSFVLFVSTVKTKTHGEVIQHASFDNSVWTDMIPKIMLDYPDMPRMRPALNWGIQYRTLVVKAPGDKDKLLRDHLEIVYTGVVYDGWGQRPVNPVHVVVPDLMDNIQCRVHSSEDSGLLGLLQRFLPPFTSPDPETRDQQIYGLCAFIGIHNYRLIVDYLGGCPGLTFISTEPGTLKTDTSKQGTLLGGDPGFILTSTSSDPAIEAAQCQASWVTVHDDAESSKGTHKTLVGGYNGGTKGLVSRAVNGEKLGGVCKTENLTANKVMHPKTVEGREIIIHMMKNLREATAGMTQSERYDARRGHLKAMAKMNLPRDYMAKLTGKHFTYRTLEEDDVLFIKAHKTACDLLSEVRPEYSDRRLASQAIPFAIFLLIEEDVEEAEDDHIKAMFVEAFGDRQKFFNVCVKEIEKGETLIEKHMDRTNFERTHSNIDYDETEGDDDIPENQEDKLKVLLELFKDKDIVTLTKYIKVFTQGKSQVLGVAHAKLNADFEKIFKKLKLQPDDDHIKHVKSFTKPNGDQITGKGSMITTCCKVFHLKNLSRNFRDMVLNLYNMEHNDDEEDEVEDDNLAASQDFPQHSQSRSIKTLKICNICRFKTRDSEEFGNHMKVHRKCLHCGLHFIDGESLDVHDKAFHAVKSCEVCGKEVLESKIKKHMNSHNIEKGYSKVVRQGKVKASKVKATTEDAKDVKPPTAYRVFLKTMRPIIRNENPDASPQELISLLNVAWNKEKENGNKKIWEKKAREKAVPAIENENDDTGEHAGELLLANHAIQKCNLCGLMIANVSRHMLLSHNRENDVEEVEPTVEESTSIEDASEFIPPLPVLDSADGNGVDEEPLVHVQEDKYVEGDIVMVLRKTLHWPGKVLKFTPKTCDVMIFDKARTVENKAHKFIIPFSTDLAICDGRGASWIKAWKEAKKEFDLLKAKQ